MTAVPPLAWGAVPTPFGPLHVATTPNGVARILLPVPEPPTLEATTAAPAAARRRLREATEQLQAYLAGARRVFDVPLDLPGVPPFRAQVLEALARVPWGTTVSYRDLAVAVGRPGAARAVGSTMATNPVPIVLPCHRVLQSGGRLGGYGGGLELKRWLLELEGVVVPAPA